MSPDAPKAVREVLLSGYIGQGSKVEEFETRLHELFKSSTRPLTTSTCTHALDLAFHLCGIGPGDSVISTPATCSATNTGLVHRRANIIWADVDPITGLINPVDVRRKVTAKTKAIIAVDWGGKLCDYDTLNAIGPPVIEDAAHAFMAEPMDKRGRYVCYSFQAIKHLTTVDGGAIIVPQEEYKRAKLLRWYGFDREAGQSFRCAQKIEEIGYKYHMNDVAATIGLSNIDLALRNLKKCRTNARNFCAISSRLKSVALPEWNPSSSWWLYTLLVDNPSRFIKFASKRGIVASQVHARSDQHPQLKGAWGPLPGVGAFYQHMVCVPVGWWLLSSNRVRVLNMIMSYDKKM